MAIPSVNFTEVRDFLAGQFERPSATPILPEKIQAPPLHNSFPTLERIPFGNSLLTRKGNTTSSSNHSSTLLALGLTVGIAGLALFAAKRHPAFFAVSLLIGTSACFNLEPIQVSEIKFNEKIAGDLRPTKQIDESSRPFFNNGENPNTQLSELYPDIPSKTLLQTPSAPQFWIGKNTLQAQGLRISWELVTSGFTSEVLEGDIKNKRVRGCSLPNSLEDPDTGEKLVERGKGFVFNLNTQTMGLEVCESEKCNSYDLRKILSIDRFTPKNNMTCFINGQIPINHTPSDPQKQNVKIQGDAIFTLFLANQDLQRQVAGVNNAVHPLFPVHPLLPEIKMVEGCRTFLRPLHYRPDISGIAVVDDNGHSRQAKRLRWCWGVEGNHLSKDLDEFFDSNLIVREVVSCKKSSVDSPCETVSGEYLNVLLSDYAPQSEVPGSYILEDELTPSHIPNDPSKPLNWCLENRIFPNPNGTYPDPRWKEDEALYLEFKVCEKPS